MAASKIQTRQWQLNVRPKGMPELDGPNSTFKLVNVTLPELEDKQVLVKQLYISNDAAQRVWISVQENQPRLYVPPVEVGDVMRARSVGEVIESRSEKIPTGAIVLCTGGWSEYTIQPADKCVIIPKSSKFSITHSLGALGLTGVTAYYGLSEIVRTTKDDTVVVSGAAGATGSMAIQVAKKLIGCKKVIGIAGTDEKCRWVERLGADKCINYKTPTWREDLAEATERKVDVFYDNVGGEILDVMLTHMNLYGRIALCGAIARYNVLSDAAKYNHFEEVITQRLELRGFVVLDYWGSFPKTIGLLTKAAEEGRLDIGNDSETVVQTDFSEIPKTWMRLYDGTSQGKLVTKL